MKMSEMFLVSVLFLTPKLNMWWIFTASSQTAEELPPRWCLSAWPASFLVPPPPPSVPPPSHASFTWSPVRLKTRCPAPHCSSAAPLTEAPMAFRKALKRTAVIGGGAVATAFGLSQLIEYRKKQVSQTYRRAFIVKDLSRLDQGHTSARFSD